MLYEYQCPVCQVVFDVEHPMSETSNPSEETLKKLTCNGSGGCSTGTQEEKENVIGKVTFKRVFSATYSKFNSLSVADKQSMLKKRSHEDFKKNIEERKNGLQSQAIKEMKNIVEKKD